jgi:enoyl-CoA hydratase/carnithine racemase
MPAGRKLRSCGRLGAATFATPGVDIGLFCSTPMVALSRNVPRKQAMEMLLTGEPISAATAREIGLVNRVVAAGTERDAAIALAQKVALKSAYTVKLGKAAFYRQAEMSLADAYRYAAEVMTENMMARDAEEGIGAFIEKREPKWQDRNSRHCERTRRKQSHDRLREAHPKARWIASSLRSSQ